jgi:hypothetical protein
MEELGSHRARCVLAALLGAVGGGLLVAFATRAIPRLMSEMIPKMMQGMMEQMGADGCDPMDM